LAAAEASHCEAGYIVRSLVAGDEALLLDTLQRLLAMGDEEVINAVRTALLILLHCAELLVRDAAASALRLTAHGAMERVLTLGNYAGLRSPCQEVTQLRAAAIGGTIRQVVCGAGFVCGITDGGRLFAWGIGSSGQLGVGGYDDLPHPTILPGLGEYEAIVHVDCGQAHVLACTDRGEVFGWGDGRHGQLGVGSCGMWASPQLMQGLDDEDAVMVACGSKHSAVLTHHGALYSMGANEYGQLGAGDRAARRLPCMVIDHQSLAVARVSCGANHTLASGVDGQLYTWGRGSEGQLGLGDRTGRTYPHQVVLSDAFGRELTAAQLAAGVQHSCISTVDGHMYAWGCNMMGQLGVPHLEFSLHPVLVQGFHAEMFTRHITCGHFQTAVVSTDGSLFTWGQSPDSEAGTECSFTPQQVSIPGDASDVTTARYVNCGEMHMCVLTGY